MTLGTIIANTALTAMISIPVHATIIGGSVTGGTAQTAGGVFLQLAVPLSNLFGTPDSVGNDNFQSPDLFAFNELQNALLSEPLIVDVGLSPLPTGTRLSSYYVFFDPGPTQRIIGTVTFDSDVLGIVTSTATLAVSDFLANTGVNYLNPANRGLEPGDSATISAANQVSVDLTASSPGDYIRVLTLVSSAIAVPEPTGAALLALALTPFVIAPRRHKPPSPPWK